MRTFRILFMLAWRNLWRNHRRTLIMLAAIGVGIWAMIFMTALTQGMVNEMTTPPISTTRTSIISLLRRIPSSKKFSPMPDSSNGLRVSRFLR
mgnify:CR=1 FL=1